MGGKHQFFSLEVTQKCIQLIPGRPQSGRVTSRVCCQRPYHVENTSSRPITEVKQHRARLVLRWVTAWERRVSLASFLSFPKNHFGENQIPMTVFCFHHMKFLTDKSIGQ